MTFWYDLVVGKRTRDGRWLLDNPHAGKDHFDMEGGSGTASRWITLRALRVLDWSNEGVAGAPLSGRVTQQGN